MPSPTKSRKPADEEILHLKYKLLSDVKRTPAAVMSGKGNNYGGGNISLDGTMMSSQMNTVYSPNATTNRSARSGHGGDENNATDGEGRNPIPPGPGAYVMPSIWTPTKGPIHWQKDMFPYGTNSPRDGVRSHRDGGGDSPRSKNGNGYNNTHGSTTSSAMYLPPTPSGKAFSMSSRWDGPQPKHVLLPGPGSYEPLKSQFGTDKFTKKCVFGMRTKPLESTMKDNPGPGTYEAVTADTLNQQNGASYKTTRMAGKWSDPTPPKAPHALTYRVPAPFDKPLDGCATIKGRLDHPMDDHNASHEAAKTERPHTFERRFKAKPVA